MVSRAKTIRRIALAFALVLFAWADASRLCAASKTRSAPATTESGLAIKKISGANYVDARAWAARLGLKATWIEANRRMKLASAFTTIVIEADRRELTLNGLRVFVGEPVVFSEGTLWIGVVDVRASLEAVMRSTAIDAAPPAVKIICVDAGHGGTDTGTQNAKLKLDEKPFTLDVALKVKKILQSQGYTVVMTRADDRFIELAERSEIANRSGADLFVSIHFNAAPPTVVGTETYIVTRPTQRSTSKVKREKGNNDVLPGNGMDEWNAVLGYQMHRNVLGKLKTFDRGLKFERYKVLTLVKCPGVLVESGYISNDGEARKIASESYREDIADGIVDGINAYAAQVAAWKRK